MKIKRLTIVGLMLSIFALNGYTEDLPDTVFPWGVYTVYQPAAERDTMQNDLGFNLINLAWDGWNDSHITNFMSDGFVVYPNRGPNLGDGVNYFRYAESYYALIEAEDEDSDIRFRYHHDDGEAVGDFWQYEEQTAATICSSLAWWHSQYNSVLNDSLPTDYTRYIRLKIEEFASDTLLAADTIAILYCDKGSNGIDTAYVGAWDFYDDVADTFYAEPITVECDEFTLDKNRTVSYWIYSTGRAKLYIDYFKVPDDYGIELIDQGLHDNELIQSAYYLFSGNRVAGWYMADEPKYEQFRSLGYIDSLIKDPGGSDIPRVVTAFNRTDSATYARNQTYDFIKLANPEAIWADIYPFFGGQILEYTDTSNNTWRDTSWTTDYTGYGINNLTKHKGLQAELNKFTYVAEYVANACDENSINWWLMPQAFAGRRLGACWEGNQYIEYISGWLWRMSTKSELSCTTFMGLSENARGIVFWRYHTGTYPNCPNWNLIGMVDSSSVRKDIWYAVEEMGPYIEAIGQLYLSLTWDQGYFVAPDSSFPAGTWISSITTWSHPDTTNPDLGWFHVGEYTEGSDKYIMLVNRACSQGPDDPTPAPSVTATVKFDPSNLGLGNYVYIIDIAESVYLDSTETDTTWVGIPDTTYSATLDGVIPFTTVLGPGEGRLYKIEGVSQISLIDTINTNYTYQGKIRIVGDATVPGHSTMKILGPARFEFYRCDGQTSGKDTLLTELIINGKLNAKGTSIDSIFFVSDTTIVCDIGLGVNPQPGDWYGIVDKSSARDTLAYCAIKYAYKGFFGDSTSNAVLRHCAISNSELDGIHLKYTGTDKTWIDTCLIFENDNIGIYAKSAPFIATGNTITENSQNAISINLDTFSASDKYELYYNNISKGDSSSTSNGVVVSGTLGNEPTAIFEGNWIEDFTSCGVYLARVEPGDWGRETGTRFIGSNSINYNGIYGLWCNYSSPAIYTNGNCDSNNLFSYNSTFGIFCTKGSNPNIKRAKLSYNSTSNLACALSSYPCLGDTALFDGYNEFKTTVYDIIGYSGSAIKAQNNYWGESTPDTLDFYPDAASVTYMPYLRDPCTPLGKIAGYETEIPDRYVLYQNYPNPFNPSTSISFDLPKGSDLRILVYNILGQRVRVLGDKYFGPGNHVIEWDGRNQKGANISSGVYFYLIETDDFADVKKMLILR